MKKTDVNDFFSSLNAGVFANQIGTALSDVGSGVVEFGKKGKVVITLELSQIGESNQVKINHKLDYKVPPSAAVAAKTPRWTPRCTSPLTAWSYSRPTRPTSCSTASRHRSSPRTLNPSTPHNLYYIKEHST